MVEIILFLDDLWKESRDEWLKLREFMCLGGRGSRIVVTTRSKKVVGAIGDDPVYELRGLSNDDSWHLFERIAFKRGTSQADDSLVNIGKDIVKKCANVPLAIRVVGSMLYDQDKSKWKLFQRIELAKMGQGEDSIMPILKCSYHHLTPQLKSCFSYCAIFPKDYVIRKKLLICLWSAQGYLGPMNDMQNTEDVGDEYFSILLQRCFLQDIKKNQYGEINSCKMHDLIHDLAQEVAGNDSYLMGETSTSPFDRKTRHLSISCWSSLLLLSPSDAFCKLRGLRTFLQLSFYKNLKCESEVITVLAKCRRLRVLDLHELSIKAIPSTIKNLLHLRYLDLSDNKELKILPESITTLYNLQVLNLSSCRELKELPKDLRKLVNLRHLDTSFCIRLTHMPFGMGNLSGLCTLTRFVLGRESSNKAQIGQLKDLMPLINLRGTLKIVLQKGYAYDSTNTDEGSYLLNKEHIKALSVEPLNSYHPKEPGVVDERLLERLEPHRDLEEINILGYNGTKLPRWVATLSISLPRLVSISLVLFHNLQHLPALSQLQHLKSLTLANLPKVELMEYDNVSAAAPSFPSLESLVLQNCPCLKSFPACPLVKGFSLYGLIEDFTFTRPRDDEAIIANAATATSFSAPCSSNNNNNSAGDVVFDIRRLETDNLGLLKSLFGESIRSIRSLTLCNMEMENLSSIVQEYQRYGSTIHQLTIRNCQNLKSLLGGGIEHLTNLNTLQIKDCRNLELEEEKEIPWKYLQALFYLSLKQLPLVHLPKGIQYLTSLQCLEIFLCLELEDLPDWLACLKSLQSLEISCCHKLKSLPEAILPCLKKLRIDTCDGLKESYSEPDGKDWSKISHIPHLNLSF